MEYLPYILDLIVIVVIAGSGIIAYRKGFVTAALYFLPMVAGLIATKLFTPAVSQLLRKTPFFASLSGKISDNLQLDAVVGDAAMQTQTEIINNMKLPDFLKDTLLENNNPVIYDLLDVESLQNYVAGFLANICINIISVLLVFIVVWILMHMLLKALNLISKLPVLSFFNQTGGMLIGLLKGISIVWVCCILLTFFQCNAQFAGFFTALQASHIAKLLYENNILLLLILKIFA